MSLQTIYTPSHLLNSEAESHREHAFTRWMTRDLMQAATDFCKNIGLVAIYAECSSEGLTRYLFWRPTPGTSFEVRSGRAKEQFEAFDRANTERGHRLLSLHISEQGLYSAVWISSQHYEDGKAYLAVFGITTPEKSNSGKTLA